LCKKADVVKAANNDAFKAENNTDHPKKKRRLTKCKEKLPKFQVTNCPHVDEPNFKNDMCYNCYKEHLNLKKVITKCPHVDKTLY
jgi:hypothetical protein